MKSTETLTIARVRRYDEMRGICNPDAPGHAHPWLLGQWRIDEREEMTWAPKIPPLLMVAHSAGGILRREQPPT